MEFVHVVEVEDDRAAAGRVGRDVDVVRRARGRQAAVIEVEDGLRVAGKQAQVGRPGGAADGGALRREVRGVERADGGGGRRVVVLGQHVARHDAAGGAHDRGGGLARGIEQVADRKVARHAPVPPVLCRTS